MTTAVIIPARYESTRFPGKPLVKIADKSMLEWVIKTACGSKLADRVIVATGDKRIFDFVKNISNAENKTVEAFMTLKEHKCGTDRIAEVVRHNPDIKYVVNLQGDEPLMPSGYIDKVLEPLLSNDGCPMSSLISPLENPDDLKNPNIVKVIMDKEGYALYFSRSQIPYNRNDKKDIQYFKHLGIYGYTRETILQFAILPQSNLELTEQLEQLRALENGIKIKLEVVPKAYPAVDNPEDVSLIEEAMNSLKVAT